MSRRIIAVALALGTAFGALSSASAQSLTLSSNGGGTLGALTSLTVEGTPGDQYFLVISLSTGPTLLPPPHQPSSLDVGLELFTLSTVLPGFSGVIGPGGSSTAFLPFPIDPILLALPSLNFQAIRIVNNAKIDGKSNLCQIVPALSQTTRLTLTNMSDRRAGYAVVEMPDGSILYFGGGADGNVASFGQTSIDRYDPCTQSFTKLGDMLAARTSHTATLLGTGFILLAGGADDLLGEPVKTAELYDPVNNLSLPLPDMSIARALHSANLLPDGRVIVMGGTGSFMNPIDIIENGTATTEIFNPISFQWAPGPIMAEPRIGHRTDTLLDGRLLVTGGYSFTDLILFKLPRISSAGQIYIPGGGAGAFGGQIQMNMARFGHTTVVADSGSVYLFGGATDTTSPLNPIEVDSIERFDVGTAQFTLLPAVMSKPRGASAIAKLPNNQILICGGSGGNLATPSPDDSIDLFDIGSEGVITSFVMLHVRSNFSAVALPDGTIMVAGGGEEFLPNDPSNPVSFFDAEIIHL